MAAGIAQRCARGRWTWLAASVAVATAALLLVGGERLRSTFDSLTRATPDESHGPLLEGPEPDPALGGGPVLQGARRQAPGEREPAHGPVTVTVLDRAGVPMAGVCVRSLTRSQGSPTRLPPETQTQVTDASGRGNFEDLPYDGAASVTVVLQAAGRDDVLGPSHHASYIHLSQGKGFFYVTPGKSTVRVELGTGKLVDLDGVSNGLEDNSPAGIDNGFFHAIEDASLGSTLVTGPEVTLTLDRGLPLEVDVRAADGGRALSTRWQVTPRLEWAPGACESPRIPVTAGSDASIYVKVEPPRGMVAPLAEPWSVWVHPGAARLRAVVPVRPEAEIVAQFPEDVLPFREDQWAAEVTVGGEQVRSPRVRLGRNGRVVIFGVPHLLGEEVVIGGLLADRWCARGRATIGANSQEPILVSMRCDPAPPDPLDGAPLEMIVRGIIGRVGVPWAGLEFRLLHGVPPQRGALRMCVRGPSGAPAQGASVRVSGASGVTDSDGVVLFETLPAGPYSVTVGGADAPTTVQTEVKSGETTDAQVRTHAGGALAVEVVDVLERALPFATVTVQQPSGFPWIDLDGDVQRIDPYTDERGRRTLRTVEPGLVKVSAAYGSRSVEAEVEVLEGETTRVRLVLPAADGPAKVPEPPPAPPEPDAPAR